MYTSASIPDIVNYNTVIIYKYYVTGITCTPLQASPTQQPSSSLSAMSHHAAGNSSHGKHPLTQGKDFF